MNTDICCLLEKVREYADEVGLAPEVCLHEALTEWLSCIAGPRLEAFRAVPVLIH